MTTTLFALCIHVKSVMAFLVLHFHHTSIDAEEYSCHVQEAQINKQPGDEEGEE